MSARVRDGEVLASLSRKDDQCREGVVLLEAFKSELGKYNN